jgi:hypothetical protein
MKKVASFVLASLVALSARALGAAPVVWVVPSSLLRVRPTNEPGVGTDAVAHAAPGEYQSFQVAIQALSGGLTNVNFSVSTLAGPRGAALSRANLILFREWHLTVKVHSPTYMGPPNLPITNMDTFPDALIPFLDPATGKPPVEAKYEAVPFDLRAQHNAVIWIDVFAPRDTGEGEYQGINTVTSDQGRFEGRIRVYVRGLALPLERTLKSSFNGCCMVVPGASLELLRNRRMPDAVDLPFESIFIDRYRLNATDARFLQLFLQRGFLWAV